ncbi:MAG TPA: hypothetical protein VGL08_13970 [Paraburkholderia sp.]|jgi:Tfp pilus assembly protein PilV
MNTSNAKCYGGESLIEVMLAVALMAITALGLVAAQLWTMRDARATALRERAAFVADAVVEAMQGPSQSAVGVAQWKARAASLLPQGEASVSSAGEGVSIARVMWATVANRTAVAGGTVVANEPGPRTGDVIDLPAPCGDIAVPASAGCVVLAFSE